MNERILLVEDEEALSVPLSDRLRREGYQVQIAADVAKDVFQKTNDLFWLRLMVYL